MNNFEVDVYKTFLEKCANLCKTADILPKLMPLEDWNTGTLAEKNRYLDSLPVGDYQLFSKNGVPEERFAHGIESDVFHALGSTKNPELSHILEDNNYGNVVIKKPATRNILEQFTHDMLDKSKILSKQRDYKRDIQEVAKNKIWLPFNDYEGAGKGNVASEFLRELYAPDEVSLKDPEIKKLLKHFNTNTQNYSVGIKPKEKIRQEWLKNTRGTLDLPMVRGKSGKLYYLYDIHLPEGLRGTNLGIDSKNNLKLMDYMARPVGLRDLELVKILKNQKLLRRITGRR